VWRLDKTDEDVPPISVQDVPVISVEIGPLFLGIALKKVGS